MDCFVIKCTPKDIDKLIKVSIKTFLDTFSSSNEGENMKRYIENAFNKQKIEKELNNLNSSFYLLYNGIDEVSSIQNEPIGYFKLNDLDAQGSDNYEDTSNSIELERIYLLKEHQKKGLGQFMMDKAIEISKNKKRSYIWLGVWEKNYSSLEFYKKNGFIKFGCHTFTIGNDHQNDFLLKLNLISKTK
ncbi:hypothetical protein RB653_007694 [Dictyostelium firmibasis]|uniref:N-acetyltransferase domain-containing protein n=1 Tax=Dictyostelium firmibasis TaxID=79012 RepID=A0AAN7TWX7_9MYCE